MPKPENLYRKIALIGSKPTDSPLEIHRIEAVNEGAIISFSFSIFTSILFVFFLPSRYYWIPVLGTSSYLLTLLYNHLGWRKLARYNIWLVSLPIFFWISSAFGEESYGHLMYLVIILGTIATFNSNQYAEMVFIFFVPIVLVIILYFTNYSLFDIPEVNIHQRKIIGIFNLVGCFLGVASTLITFIRDSKTKSEKLEKSEAEIRAQFTELQKAHKELDLIVYSVTHDLRAPISSSLALVDICSSEPEKNQMYLDMQKKSLVRMDKFIVDVLFYYKNARIELHKEEINCEEVVEEIFSLNENNGVEIEKKYEENIGSPIISDKLRINILLSNLIGNSVRYYNPKSEKPFVHVSINSTPETINLTVEDNGQGIKKEHLPRVFDMFYRANKNANGSGLGLYIVKETVAKLGGVLEVDSTLGEGTKFHISLPNAQLN